METTLYDNGGETFDRYTLVIEYKTCAMKFFYGLSDNPLTPQGFNQFIGDQRSGDNSGITEGEHLGTVIAIKDTNEGVQKAIQQRISE